MKNKSNTSLSLRKVLLSALVAAPLATLPAPLWALPANQTDLNAQVSSTSPGVTVTSISGTQVNIASTTNTAVVKWNNFGAPGMTIVDNDLIVYSQPSSTSGVLNLVIGSVATNILGDITSNGQVYVLNRNGITIGTTSIINTAGLGLSTADEAEFVFLANGTLSNTGVATTGITINAGAMITIGSTGNVSLVSKTANVAGTINAGQLSVTTQNGAINLANDGALVVGGNAGTSSGYGTLDINSGGSAVNLAVHADDTIAHGVSHTVTTNGGAVSATNAVLLGRGNGTATALTINSGTGTVTIPDLGGNGALRFNLNLMSGASAVTMGNASELRLGTSTITHSGAGDALALTALAGGIATGGDTTFLGTNRNIALTSGDAIDFSGAGDLVFTALANAAGDNVKLVSKSGSIALNDAITSTTGTFIVTANTSITQTAGQVTTGNATFEATNGSITLTNAGNNFATAILKGAPGGASISDTDALIIGNGTNVTGSAVITSAGLLTFAGTETYAANLTATGVGIADSGNSISVFGTLNLNGGTGGVFLDGATNNGVGLAHRFGQVNVAQADLGVRIYETTTANIGTVTTAGSLRVWSSAGDVIQTGTITAGGAEGVQVGAGTAAVPGNITLTNASNSFGAGGLSIIDDFTILSNAANFTVPDPFAVTVGTLLARDVTIATNGSFTLNRLVSSSGTGIAGNLNLTSNTGSLTLSTGAQAVATNAIVVGGTVTLNAPNGLVTAANDANQISTVTVTANGAVDIDSESTLTVNATLTGAGAATFEGEGLRTGAISSSRSGAADLVSFISTGSSNSILDSVSGMSIFGNVQFSSEKHVTIDNAGHSFGRVGVTTLNDGNATITESGTLRLGAVSINDDGNFVARSTTGDIIQATDATGIDTEDTARSLTFSAPLGIVRLDNAGGGNDLQGIIHVTANGNITITQGRNTILGNIVSSTGGLSVTGTGANRSITQADGARINTFDVVSLIGTGTGAITINRTGNRLGGVIAQTGSGAVTLTESTTLNLLSVITTGTLTATSESHSIIDSTRSGVTANYIAGNTTTPATTAIGAATFSAPNGSVTLGIGDSNFSTVGFTTSGSASIIDGPSTGVAATNSLTLSTSTIGGTLGVVSTINGATLNQSGPLNVSGDVTLTTSSGNIDLSTAANQFGGVRFTANNVIIAEATTFNLRAGSVATGPVQISTSGDFVTSGVGGSSFTNNLTISAQGTIVPGAGSLLVVGTFTVFSPSTKDLSALSKSGNLTNKDPVNLGTGTYIPPGP